MEPRPQRIWVSALLSQFGPAEAIFEPGSACGMPYAEEDGFAACTFQPDSCDQMLSRQPNSEGDMPNSGISARARVFVSAVLRSSVLVTATPEALDSARTLVRSAAGRRSSTERDARCSRAARSVRVRPWAGVEADSAAAAPSIGEDLASTPVETASTVAKPETPESRATRRRRRPKRVCSGAVGALRCLAACFSDKVGLNVDDTGVMLAQRAGGKRGARGRAITLSHTPNR